MPRMSITVAAVLWVLGACTSTAQKPPAALPAPAQPASIPKAAIKPPLDLKEARKNLERAFNRGEIERVEQLLQQALGAYPTDHALRAQGARMLWVLGQRAKAVELADAHLGQGPPDGELVGMSAGMHLELADDGPNISHTRGMVTASPSQDPTADARWVAEHRRQAERLARLARGIEPRTLRAHLLLLDALGAREKWKEAAQVLSDVPEGLRSARAVALRAGGILTKAGNPQAAVAVLRNAVEDHPRDVPLLKQYAAVLEATGDTAQAQTTRARARFFAFLVPGTALEYDRDIARTVDVLAGAYTDASQRTGLQRTLQRLAKQTDSTSTELLAGFAWRHTHDALESEAYRALEERGAAAHSVLMRLGEHADSVCTVRQALEILGRHRETAAFPLMLSWLEQDHRPGHPMQIPTALAALGDPRAVPPLVRLLSTPPPQDFDDMRALALQMTRAEAAVALGEIGDARAEQALRQSLGDADLKQAAQMGLCLLTLRDAECLPVVQQASVEDEEGAWTRETMLRALRRVKRLGASPWAERLAEPQP